MRMMAIVAVAGLALGVSACGQTKAEAAADLAAKEEASAPKPAEPGAPFVGEMPPAPLADYAAPVDPEAAVEAEPAAEDAAPVVGGVE